MLLLECVVIQKKNPWHLFGVPTSVVSGTTSSVMLNQISKFDLGTQGAF